MSDSVLWSATSNKTTGIADASINAGVRLLGSEIDNTTERKRFASVDLTFSHASAPVVDTPWSLWIVYALDGTNYEDGDASVEPTRGVSVVVPARAVTGAQKQSRINIPIGPYKQKILLKNGTDQNATGVTVLMRTHSEEIVG